MKTIFTKTVFASIIMLMTSVASNAETMVYNYTTSNNKQVKFEYEVDNEGRVESKTAYQWDEAENVWKPMYIYTARYGKQTNKLIYAKWNNKNSNFSSDVRIQEMPAEK